MRVNGLKIPDSFVAEMSKKTLNRPVGCWELKEEVDAFGNKLATDLGEVWLTEEQLIKETKELPNGFEADGFYGEKSEYSNEPGFIEDILDFSDIVAFAISADGAPFCFDYRNNKENPEIIWWDDVYWRKISNSYDDFIALFYTNS